MEWEGTLRRVRGWCVAGKQGEQSRVGWIATLSVLSGLLAAGVGAYVVYKYRLRVRMGWLDALQVVWFMRGCWCGELEEG